MTTPLWSDNPSKLDLLGFADVTAPVTEAVMREKLDPVTVGIEGDWGSGKTTMLDLLADQLGNEDSVVVVQTHPWEYDPATDPKATLIAEVLAKIHVEAGENENLSDAAREKFRKLARRIQVSKLIKLGVNSALSLGLPKIDEILGLFKDNEAETVPDQTLQGFREEFQQLMADDLTSIARVVVLVDDLDRCLPETVIATLEGVKLFLSVPKMAFVIAADRRSVAHAVATKYEPSPLAAELGRQYLEKIVHIPVRVPALGRAETEAYLALLMLQRHVDDAALKPFVEHCDSRRSAGKGDVLKGLPSDGLGASAKEDLQLAAMLAPVLFERMEGNPRRLKRFLNAYWLRATVAGRRGITLQPNALAKLMVLEALEDAAFNALLGWMREGVLDERLKELEAGKTVKGSGGETSAEALKDWAKLTPSLAGVDLGPYLRLAASLRSQVGPESGLRPEVRALIDPLLSAKAAERKAAEKLIPDALQETRLSAARYLVDKVRSSPEKQKDIAPALAKLGEDEVVAEAMVEGLREFAPERVEGPLVIHLAPTRNGSERLKAVVKGWVESGGMGKGFEAIARKNLGMPEVAKD